MKDSATRFLLRVAKSKIDGKGLYCDETIRARAKIGELTGALVSHRTARRKAAKVRRLAIVEFDDGMAIDGSINGNEFRYINHSCCPNTFMRVFQHHIEFYSLRDIRPGEELTPNANIRAFAISST